MVDPIFNSLGDMYDDDEDSFERSAKENRKSSSTKASKKTPILDNFGRDLTDLAEKNLLDPVIGRKSEIERVTQILGRRKKNNPVLIGEAGTGKTAIVEGLALQISSGGPQWDQFRGHGRGQTSQIPCAGLRQNQREGSVCWDYS